MDVVPTVPPGTTGPTLAGECLVFTGRLSALSRREARSLVSRLGGTTLEQVNARTTILVVGSGSPAPGSSPGNEHDDEKSHAIRRASAINAREPGRIRVMSEEEFCRAAGVAPVPGSRAQWYALPDILGMYPHLREDHLRYLRKWNLVQPEVQANGGTYFTFPDLAVLRQLNAEMDKGAPFRTALKAVQASREGQLRLDFSLEAEPAKVIRLTRAEPPKARAREIDSFAAEEYFNLGSALDDGDPGKHEAASRAYRRALEVDPYLVPALINLANIHYARENLIEAEVLYERAIALQGDLFEAHFNLGNVFHDLGRLDEARAAYDEALRLNPDYPDAHFYMAVTLEKLGLSPQARPYWRRYRDLAPNGEWVELAREFGE